MPDSFATRCGSTDNSHIAWMMLALMLSWPQPAHSVLMLPS